MKDRVLNWETKFLELFPQIIKIDFANTSAKETINQMQGESHVVAPHGAGSCNIIFCNQQTKILEITDHDHFFQPCYSRLSSLLDLKHHIISLDFKNKSNSEKGLSFLKEVMLKFLC